MTRNQPERRVAAVIAVASLVCAAAGCATSSVSGRFPTAHADGGPMRLFVMPAASMGNPSTGNVGFSFVEVQRLVDDQVLAVAREEDPNATLAPVDGSTPYRPMEPYISAAAPARVTPAELNAAGYARQHGGTHLLVPTIDVTFSSHSRATLNQSAANLLGDEFRKAVKKLLAE